ncbi:MAG: phage major capsid protein [Deltaproteobacteria bacterium]|jgi:HK97 family phage major capsid protein|nr:phage major capsid protein [Deltaproteobacteria bacterium]
MNKDEKLAKMQGEYRTKLARLKELKNLETRSSNQETEMDTLLTDMETLGKDIDRQHKAVEIENEALFDEGGDGEGDGQEDREGIESNGYEMRSPGSKKNFRSLFGKEPINDYRWNDQDTDYFSAVFAGRFHPNLTTRSMVEEIASDGGFLVPTETSETIHNVALENEIILPNAFVMPMKTNEKNIPGLNIGDHSSNLFGGFTASYKPEAGTLDEANPKARLMTLNAKKLTGFLKMSREWFDDVPGGGNQVAEICGKGLAWYRDKSFLKGTGSGEPMGIINSDCLVTVDAESGQNADTLIYENLINMMARMFAGSFSNSVWVCHQTCIPQLLTLSVAVGVAGSHIPVMTKGKDGGFEILTRPVIFTEKTESLGNKGDIMLCDFAQYVVGLREELRLEYSPHVYFTTDQIAARLIARHDGMPLWDKALTLEDGATTVSPFVTLAERA